MRLFPKTCVSAGAVTNTVNSTKKTKQGLESQYEYVRKEYGFDYVPPSQYVPSHSMSDDEEYDSETIELQYRGGAPVKIIHPSSDLSGSIEADDEIMLPTSKVYEKPSAARKIRAIHPETRKKRSNRQKKTSLIREEQEVDDEEEEELVQDYQDDLQRRRRSRHRPDSALPRQSQIPFESEAPENVFHKSERRDRDRSRSRPKKNALKEQDDPEVFRRRSYLHEDETDDLNELGIEGVHTAFSYSSDDSAESLIEERSKASRYSTPQKSRKHNRRQDLGAISRGDHVIEKSLMDQEVVKTGNWRKSSKGWEHVDRRDGEQRDRNRITAELEKYETTHYDRKKGTRKETRQEIPDDFREHAHNNIERRDVDPKYSTERRKPDGSRRRDRGASGDDDPHVGPLKTRKEGWHYEEDWDQTRKHNRRRDHSDLIYYATPSGRVASDYELSSTFVEPSRQQKKSSKGFLGRIRDSVRGPKDFPTETKSWMFETATGQGENRGRKSTSLFAQAQPSMRSEVSYDKRRSTEFYHTEPEVPSVLPMTRSYEHRRDPEIDKYREEDYRVRRRSSSRRRKFHSYDDYYDAPQQVGGEHYKEDPPTDFSCRSRENVSHGQKKLSAPPVPFKTTRRDTPVLRANPDRRRSMSRHYTKGINDHHVSQPTHDLWRFTLEDQMRYGEVSSPRLVRKHPHIQDSIYSENAKGLRMGCY